LRRVLFWILLVALVAAVIEAASFGVISILGRSLRSYSQLVARRSEVAKPVTESASVSEPLMDDGSVPFRTEQVIHPYLGFVMDAERHRAALDSRNRRDAVDLGFPRNTHSLFQTPSDRRAVVAVFGGSVAELFTLEGTDELVRQLRLIPRFVDKDVIVLCLASAGYKQPQQLMTLNYFLSLGAHFDIVINIDGFNEVALTPTDVVSKGVFPFYPRGWYYRVADLDPGMRRDIGTVSVLLSARAERAAAFSRPPLRYSITAGLVWSLLDRADEARIAKCELDLLVTDRAARGYQTRGPGWKYGSDVAMFADIAAVWRRSSMLMHLLCTGDGIEYYHFLQPNQYVAGSKELATREKRYAWSEHHPYRAGVQAGYPLLREAGEGLRRDGVRFYDLTLAFKDVREPLYVDTCCHFNRRGNMILAREIAKAIRSGSPIPS
jgi:hypothetical protein